MFGLQDYELRTATSHCEIKEFESSVKTVASFPPQLILGFFIDMQERNWLCWGFSSYTFFTTDYG